MTLRFYNHYHNGDIHVSREFVKDIIQKIKPEKTYYHHTNKKGLLADVDIEQRPSMDDFNRHIPFLLTKDEVHINTWYNSEPEIYQTNGGATLKTLYEKFKKIYEQLNINIEPYEFYIPSIDFSKFFISNVDSWFATTKFLKFVFISNGNTLSGQSVNFDFDPLIQILSRRFPEVCFIVSNPTFVKGENITLSEDIIKKNKCDLNENGYITTFCDIIIGRNSGAATFSLLKESIFGEKRQQFFCITLDNPYFIEQSLYTGHKSFTWLKEPDVEVVSKSIENA